MKKVLLSIFLFSSIYFYSQEAFDSGEWLRYRLSYSNFFKAGEISFELKKDKDNPNGLHAIGKGATSGLVKMFFKVNDTYESYFYKKTVNPYHFIRNIDEDGYTKNTEIYFNQDKNIARVIDHKHNTDQSFATVKNVQDLLSSIYSLRNEDLTHLKKGDEIKQTLFFDEKEYVFKLHFLGKEIVHTKFGKVRCLKFSPVVQEGRFFKSKRGLNIWISDDENKIPVKIRAALKVGSIRADLNGYKGLKNPFNIIFDK